MTQHEIKRRPEDFDQSLLFNKRYERGCDVEIIFNEQRIPLHSVVLGGNSRYFEINLFSTPIVPKAITLENANTEAVKAIIEYCYSGKMNLHQNDTINILETAHFLMLQSVIDDCCKILMSTLDPENCLAIRKLAERLKLSLLEKSAFNYFQIAFNGEMNDFLITMNSTQLIKILQSNVFNCAREKYFTLIKEWVNYDPVRKENLMDLLKHVQLEQFPLRILASQSKNLCFDKDCVDLFVKAFNAQSIVDISETQFNESTLVVMGGLYREECKIVEIFDTHSNNWRQHEVDFGKTSFTSVFYDQKVFVIGGDASNTVDCYDMKTWRKTSLASMHKKRARFPAVEVDEYIYAIGGWNIGTTSSLERYNIKANQWKELIPMPTARHSHNAVVVDEEIFVVGGVEGITELSVNECYTISTGNWRTCKPMLEKRNAPAVAVLHGFVYAAGGPQGSKAFYSVERYDPKVDQWTFIEPLLSPRSGARLVNFCENLIISGNNLITDYPTDTVEKYDPVTKRWSPMASLNTGRWNHNMIVVPQHLLN